ncbi:DUF4197 domain-containing protein [Pontibacter qinzhouensis]|uniref:DUF4197 domain-containing protein n=1 Tax=Pontibacter qinzhouensis TaxID=2603253 RepID=A0A5C8KC40_9BACT|nr:DUF4197 domain-containing protein [Pontibacter qinzhouensis]TXK47925.1 DUF4197 domain-containing protein [Pontibacter qinzhouensis]
MKKILMLAIFVLAGSATMAQINLNKVKQAIGAGATGQLSTEEVAEGLKQALTTGATKGTDVVSQVDGYLKNPAIMIPFPPEIKRVEDRLRQIGMGSEVDKFVVALNRAAEDAAQEAKPIFVSAIKQMTIQDAWSILKGQDDAATLYLNRTTSPQLNEKFMPIIKNSLSKVNATQYYTNLITAYNKLPMVQKVNPNLDEYATGKAIDGLFVMVAQEEKNIRQNPGARSTELLQKVFGAQK